MFALLSLMPSVESIVVTSVFGLVCLGVVGLFLWFLLTDPDRKKDTN